ncbi:uncharacterized protein LOC111359361 [Spodoptera litura]|uniref:Uncharacterized protein LOC111359361 n=1 Tax=Spodoptera litura TaxID=69820 RepID=A0A9J7ELJ3_SPOLT|nr:uncharacterized protein LOC111359361 [Spodoptera litura]
MDDDDDDVTVCSDDFNMDDDGLDGSQTILKDFDEEIIGHQIIIDDRSQPIQSSENNSQTTFYESSQCTADNITKTNSDTVKTAETDQTVHKNLIIQDRNEPKDITTNVLGELIDKLHEEEKYPTFLEELLETVDVTLQLVFEGVSSEEDEFLKKDERIQRILLLNKSVHIQIHTIEKITNILEKFHANIIETDSIYELQNIDEIENVSYIFHILEIVLKKYLKNRQNDTQSTTQNSQEILKKSSITDIWRKKWNPSQKKIEGSREKKCVLKVLSNVLNKIVVDCVTCYSLVAYSALKCFNLMQK